MDYAKEIQALEKKHETLRAELTKRESQKTIVEHKLSEVLADIKAQGVDPEQLQEVIEALTKELTDGVKQLNVNYALIQKELDALDVEK